MVNQSPTRHQVEQKVSHCARHHQNADEWDNDGIWRRYLADQEGREANEYGADECVHINMASQELQECVQPEPDFS